MEDRIFCTCDSAVHIADTTTYAQRDNCRILLVKSSRMEASISTRHRISIYTIKSQETKQSGGIPDRVWCVVRDILWIEILQRFGVKSIEREHLGFRRLVLDESIVSQSQDPCIVACLTPKLLQFATTECIRQVGGQEYFGKVKLQSASCSTSANG